LIRAVAFDLDDTLLDTSACLAPAANLEAARAMVDAGLDQPLDRVSRCRWQAARRLAAGQVDDAVCRQLGEKRPAIAAAGRRAYFERGSRLTRRSLRFVPGARALLDRLARDHLLFLVTWGDPATQRAKIRLLRLASWFSEIVVVDRRIRDDKFVALEGLLLRHALKPRQLLVVGDGWTDEIAAGKRLRTRTCWVSRGRPTPHWPPQRVDAIVTSVQGLGRVNKRFGDTPT